MTDDVRLGLQFALFREVSDHHKYSHESEQGWRHCTTISCYAVRGIHVSQALKMCLGSLICSRHCPRRLRDPGAYYRGTQAHHPVQGAVVQQFCAPTRRPEHRQQCVPPLAGMPPLHPLTTSTTPLTATRLPSFSALYTSKQSKALDHAEIMQIATVCPMGPTDFPNVLNPPRPAG